MEKTLQSGWFDIFRKKLMTEFGLDVKKINNYQSDEGRDTHELPAWMDKKSRTRMNCRPR